MEAEQEIKNLVKAHMVLHEDIMSRGSVEDLEIINQHLDIVIKQLAFWQEQGNEFRYIYDLRSYAHWLLKTFHS